MNPDDMVEIVAIVPEGVEVIDFMERFDDYTHVRGICGCYTRGNARLRAGAGDDNKRTLKPFALPEYVQECVRWLLARGAQVTAVEPFKWD